ncbi:MAG: flagellar motor protein MotB [Bacteroidales bacterium]|nr:flagellar motor protein MotB [Bacteroidales bacterium]
MEKNTTNNPSNDNPMSDEIKLDTNIDLNDSGEISEVVDKKQKDVKKVSKNDSRLKRKEVKAQKLAAKKQKQEAKIAARQQKNTRWFWFFILLLITIILLFLCDNHKKTNFIKSQQYTIDTLNNSVFEYKSKYIEKDSSLTKLLSIYNNLLQQTLVDNRDFSDIQREILKLQRIVFLQDSILSEVKSSIDVGLSGYTNDEVAVEMKDGKIYITMQNQLMFPSGSAGVQSKGMSALKTIADVLTLNPNIDVIIEGHTDNVHVDPNNKTYKDNWELSTARSVAVTRILIENYNIVPERLSAAGRSMYFPIAPNTTAEGRAKNRRIEVILTPNLEELYNIAGTQVQAQ